LRIIILLAVTAVHALSKVTHISVHYTEPPPAQYFYSPQRKIHKRNVAIHPEAGRRIPTPKTVAIAYPNYVKAQLRQSTSPDRHFVRQAMRSPKACLRVCFVNLFSPWIVHITPYKNNVGINKIGICLLFRMRSCNTTGL
jgi:hypothetical protein